MPRNRIDPNDQTLTVTLRIPRTLWRAFHRAVKGEKSVVMRQLITKHLTAVGKVQHARAKASAAELVTARRKPAAKAASSVKRDAEHRKNVAAAAKLTNPKRKPAPVRRPRTKAKRRR